MEATGAACTVHHGGVPGVWGAAPSGTLGVGGNPPDFFTHYVLINKGEQYKIGLLRN